MNDLTLAGWLACPVVDETVGGGEHGLRPTLPKRTILFTGSHSHCSVVLEEDFSIWILDVRKSNANVTNQRKREDRAEEQSLLNTRYLWLACLRRYLTEPLWVARSSKGPRVDLRVTCEGSWRLSSVCFR